MPSGLACHPAIVMSSGPVPHRICDDLCIEWDIDGESRSERRRASIILSAMAAEVHCNYWQIEPNCSFYFPLNKLGQVACILTNKNDEELGAGKPFSELPFDALLLTSVTGRIQVMSVSNLELETVISRPSRHQPVVMHVFVAIESYIRFVSINHAPPKSDAKTYTGALRASKKEFAVRLWMNAYIGWLTATTERSLAAP